MFKKHTIVPEVHDYVLYEAVNAVFVDLWRDLYVRVAVRKDKRRRWALRFNKTIWYKENVWFKRDQCLSNLFSSNLVAFCFSRFRIQTARDRPDNRVPPAATPDAMPAIWDGGAADTLWNVNHLTL